jgi:dUTP pyrophosphatase
VPVQLLSERATLPVRASAGAAGLDLCSAACLTIAPLERKLVPTDVAMAIPPHVYGRIAPRSSLAWKHGILVNAGVIDSDYRGHIQVLLVNLGAEPFRVEVGDRIAQLIFERIDSTLTLSPVAQVRLCHGCRCDSLLLRSPTHSTQLDATDRGAGGFGSTGRAAML